MGYVACKIIKHKKHELILTWFYINLWNATATEKIIPCWSSHFWNMHTAIQLVHGFEGEKACTFPKKWTLFV